MRQKLLFKSLTIFILVFGVLFLSPQVRATFEDEYKKYLSFYDSYRVENQRYVTTRNQYFQYQTLSSKNEALAALKSFLISRDDVLRSYLELLRLRNAETLYAQQLDEYNSLIIEHKNQVPSIGVLEDGIALSQILETQHIPLQLLNKQIVAAILVKKIENMKLRTILLETEAGNLINVLRSQNKDVTTLDRWLIEANKKRTLAETKLEQSRKLIALLPGNNLDKITENFNTFKFTLLEANQYLRETLSYLRELSESIKYGNY